MSRTIADIALLHGLGPETLADLEQFIGVGGAHTTVGPEGREGGPAPVPDAAGERLGRYVDVAPIAQGGMGEVRRVRDGMLQRDLAMKVAHAHLAQRTDALGRFLAEARITARLQHPGVVPVHELGQLADGRAWFTMKEVEGRTLSVVIAEAHASGLHAALPNVLRTFLRVCETVAYAHDHGVVHRDIKPDNVMVGRHGEVYVLDWGIAEETGNGGGGPRGHVSGTPAYMPPEQALGTCAADPRADVYALGATLYHVLAGRPPYLGEATDVLSQVRSGPPRPIGAATVDVETGELPGRRWSPSHPSAAPTALVAICERAMARDPAERPPSASALAVEVAAWLDGAQRRAEALRIAEQALSGARDAEALVERAQRLRAESEALLAGTRPWWPEEEKAAAWAAADEAEQAEQAARARQLEVDLGLQAALRVAPELPEAHAALVERLLARHAEAERALDRNAVADAEQLLGFHLRALPPGHAARDRATTYLRGDGALTIVTDPPDAEVLLYRYVLRNRRLVEVFERSLGRTPLREIPLAMGSYLCVLRAPGRADVRYPVEIRRGAHWHGVRPGDVEPFPVWLPPLGALPADVCYVPAGWFRAGGDPDSTSLPALDLWCDAFAMMRFPVTNAQYIQFLDDLVRRGRTDEALFHAPRERRRDSGSEAGIFALQDGRFVIVPDPDGDVRHPDWGVCDVDWYGGMAYLAWRAERDGRAWRHPGELEWEKAARGVDARLHPWGPVLDPSWCCITDSHNGPRLPSVVDSYPVDASPFGVRGLGGNMQCWCMERFEVSPALTTGQVAPDPAAGPESAERDLRVVRGGSWISRPRVARSADRGRYSGMNRSSHISIRGVFRVLP